MLRNTGRNRIGMPVAITPESWSQSDRNAGRNRPEYAKIKYYIIIVTFSALVATGNFTLVPLHSYASESPAEVKIEQGADNHPRAASDLLEWMDTHKEGAREIIKWEGRHPERIKTFVTWVITHVGKKYDVFVEEHANWKRFNRLVKYHSDAVNDFVVWCRFYPKATSELMQHSKALHWIDKHLNKT